MCYCLDALTIIYKYYVLRNFEIVLPFIFIDMKLTNLTKINSLIFKSTQYKNVINMKNK